jgi:hypothetical protein
VLVFPACAQDDYDNVAILAEAGIVTSYDPSLFEASLTALDSVLAAARKEVKKLTYVPAYGKKSATAALKL